MTSIDVLGRLEDLYPMIDAALIREIAAAGIGLNDDPLAGLGFSRSSMQRAVLHFRQNISDADADVDGAGTAFAIAWTIAERNLFRLIAAALSSPSAKGREIEIVQALAKGATVTDALAARPMPPSTVTDSGSIVTFPAGRVWGERSNTDQEDT